MATASLYLKYKSGAGKLIEGTVSAKGFEKQIGIEAMTFGAHRHIDIKPGELESGAEATTPSISAITITKAMDQASVLLLQENLTQELGGEAEIVVVKSGKDKNDPVVKFSLDNVWVSSYQVQCTAPNASEVITLQFQQIEASYTPYDSKGKAKSTISTLYNLKM